jgi:hypothetical protein
MRRTLSIKPKGSDPQRAKDIAPQGQQPGYSGQDRDVPTGSPVQVDDVANVQLPLEEYADLPGDAIDRIALMKLQLVGWSCSLKLPDEISGGRENGPPSLGPLARSAHPVLTSRRWPRPHHVKPNSINWSSV